MHGSLGRLGQSGAPALRARLGNSAWASPAAALVLVRLRNFSQLRGCPCRSSNEPAGGVGSQQQQGDFQSLADAYLASLWDKLESGLRQHAGQASGCRAEKRASGMVISLPDRCRCGPTSLLHIRILKDPHRSSLVVESDLHVSLCACGSYDSGREVFRLREGRFVADGEALHAYLEDGLAKHLKLNVDLDPTG